MLKPYVMLKSYFIRHPASVGETYWQHTAQAGSFARELFLAAAACTVHAVLPFVFEQTASRKIATLHDRMVVNRHRQIAPSCVPATVQAELSQP